MVFDQSFVGNEIYRKKRGSGRFRKKEDFDLAGFKDICNLYINAINIKKIKNFLFKQKNTKLKWLVKNKLTKIRFCSIPTKNVVLDLIKYKLKISNLDLVRENNVIKEYCVIDFLDRDFECLKLPSLFHNLKNIFPLKDNLNISVAFRYGRTLRSLVCNYNYYSKNLLKISDQDCICFSDNFIDFVNDDLGHVITGNLNFVVDLEVRDILKKGSKFRCRRHINFKHILFSLGKNLDVFIVKMARKFNCPIEAFNEWKVKLLQGIKFNYSNNYSTNNREGVFLKKSILNGLKSLKDKWIVTVIDKASNNFGFMCKSFFKQLLLNEYNGNSTYNKFNSNKKELDNRILAFSKLHKFKINRMNFPYLFPTIKFHKNPIKFRFVTCSTNWYNSISSKKFFKSSKNCFG